MEINYGKIKEVLSQLNIEKLNDMQLASLEAANGKKDVILLSPTGTGKTLAYLLPLLQLLKPTQKEVQALIVVPSRELALQIEHVFKSMRTEFKIVCCYGGHSAQEEKNILLTQFPAVVVGTPGRLLDHINRGNLITDEIQWLILDEFDKSLEFGFHDEMIEIIRSLPNLQKRFLLSATEAKEIPEFTGMNRTVKLNFLEEGTINQKLVVKQVISSEKDKLQTLLGLLCQLGSSSTIVFCNYREGVERTGKWLKEKKLSCEMFHGGMEQQEREKAIYKFSNGSSHVLISTDLAARGLDIPAVENIIHYHLPPNEETYTHRNGRTARWDASGTSYLLLGPEEKVPDYIKTIPETLEVQDNCSKPPVSLWATLYIGKGKKDKLSKGDIVGFLIKKGNLGKEDIGQIDVKQHYSFVAIKRKKMKQALTLLRGEKIKSMKTIIEEAV